jgi:surfactin synthase thioesterase subunit
MVSRFSTSCLPLLVTLERMIVPYHDLPYAFFGHSMGALLGFELARAPPATRTSRTGSSDSVWSPCAQRFDPNETIHNMPDREFRAKHREIRRSLLVIHRTLSIYPSHLNMTLYNPLLIHITPMFP